MIDDIDTVAGQFLRDHPHVLGALFALVVLLAQVQPVLAECNNQTCTGP